MNINNNCRLSCIGGSAVISTVIGIVGAVLRYTGIIEVTSVFLRVLFGISVALLGILLLVSSVTDKMPCCRSLGALLAGILGTALTSVILLGIEFAAASAVGTIITGLLLFFFSLTLLSSACLIKCSGNCD